MRELAIIILQEEKKRKVYSSNSDPYRHGEKLTPGNKAETESNSQNAYFIG